MLQILQCALIFGKVRNPGFHPHHSFLKDTDDTGLEGAEETVIAFTSSIIAKQFSSDFTRHSAKTYQCSYTAGSSNKFISKSF